jgi:hypothetical protein
MRIGRKVFKGKGLRDDEKKDTINGSGVAGAMGVYPYRQ